MSARTPETPAAPSQADGEKQENRRRKRKKMFWKKKAKNLLEKPRKDPSKEPAARPPKSPQEVSSNWKALQELLRQQAASANSALAAPGSRSKKGGSLPKAPKENRTVRTMTSEPTEKAETHSAGADSCPGIPKPGSNLDGKKVFRTQEERKWQRRDQRKGATEEKRGDIKHKRRKTEEQEEAKPDIWFDDVDPDDIEAAAGPEAAKIARRNLGIPDETPEKLAEQALVKEKAFEGLTKAVSMDCEMVGVGPTGEDSAVARVSLANLFGKCIYDKFVKPAEKVTDYRTRVSGVRPEHLRKGEDFKVVQTEVAEILRGRILVGHAVHNDLKILFLDHPKKKIRDTQKYKPFKQQVKSGRPSLKLLCEKLLNVKVQTSEHSSVQDAQAAMRLYTMAKKRWEASLKDKSPAEKTAKETRPKKSRGVTREKRQ